MLFYCRFTWYPGTSREAVGRRLLEQDNLGASHAERIKGWRSDEIVGCHFSCFYPAEAVAAGLSQHVLEAAAR